MKAVTRPLLRWHGGKWLLAPWIIQHFPPHACYVEPFGGAASVLLRKPRVKGEVFNDLDDGLVALFRVLRDEAQARRLIHLLSLTPYARSEDRDCREHIDAPDPVEAARRLIVRSFMGFGSVAAIARHNTGFRVSTKQDESRVSPACEWSTYPDALSIIVERVRGVVIEHKDALSVMADHDAPNTLHFVDPPYLPETRRMRTGGIYTHELNRADHVELLGFLQKLEGHVVLCGYPSLLYEDLLPGWRNVKRTSYADGANPRTEVLWLNPACQSVAVQRELLS